MLKKKLSVVSKTFQNLSRKVFFKKIYFLCLDFHFVLINSVFDFVQRRSRAVCRVSRTRASTGSTTKPSSPMEPSVQSTPFAYRAFAR